MRITARKFTFLFSPPRSKNVMAEFFDVSNVAFHSNKQWCSSCSTAVVSDPYTPQQRQKRVPMQQRTAMVLDFVEKFRALNSGKFPSASYTKKKIGGSFYVARSIIQRLEYNYKRELETKKKIKITNCEAFHLTEQDAKQTFFNEYVGVDTEIKQEHSRDKSKTEAKASPLSIKTISDIQIEVNVHSQLIPPSFSNESQEFKCLGVDNLHSSSPLARVTVEPRAHTSVISDAEATPVAQEPFKLKTETIILHSHNKEREVSEKEAVCSVNLQNACCPEGKKMSNEEVFRSKELYHGDRDEAEQGSATTKGSSFWIHLKSMAVDIISTWKKK